MKSLNVVPVLVDEEGRVVRRGILARPRLAIILRARRPVQPER
jgi:hypothetical protein